MRIRNKSTSGLIVSLSIGLAGCAVGPDYRRPHPDLPDHYVFTSPQATVQAPGLDGAAQRFIRSDIPGEWWTLFHSPALTNLVRTALARNYQLQAAREALRNAQELTLAEYGGLLPQVDGLFSRTRGDFPEAGSGIANRKLSYGYYDAHLTLSYNFDVWGRTRRTIEDQQAQADYVSGELKATLLMLTGNVVSTALNAASLCAQIAEQEKLVAFEREYLRTITEQFALGGANGSDVALQQSQLAQQESVLPVLENRLVQARHALAAYLGSAPVDVSLPVPDLTAMTLPEDLPVSLPISLLDQRPDIAEVEANLHRATADVGIATANRLPQFSLSAQLGSQAIQAGELMMPGNGLATLAMQLMGPIFSGGALYHQQRAAEATLREYAALWQDTTLNAVRDVANTLAQLQNDASVLQATVRQEHAAVRALNLSQTQYRLGGVGYLTVLTAQAAYQNAALSLVRARAARLSDTAALFVALGGGWWNRNDAPLPPPSLFTSFLPWSRS
ncbi:efflux transporter outer membrane subunit [Gluconacetobacter sacchari]|uniref:efflux transporter outer membrane subunit n=1 Tax=Gluconacetobacter sacchari TaxID=92759 RepID=UPI0039B5C5D7